MPLVVGNVAALFTQQRGAVRSIWRHKNELWGRTELNLRAALKHSK